MAAMRPGCKTSRWEVTEMRLCRALGSRVAGLIPGLVLCLAWGEVSAGTVTFSLDALMIQARADVAFHRSALTTPAAPAATNASPRPPAGPGSPTRE